MTIRRLILGLAAAVACAAPAAAHDYKAGDLAIAHPWSRATAPGAKVGGGFLTVTNAGSSADRLVAVTVPFAAKTELHESSIENGVARMRELDRGVEIAAGEKIEFAPGGKHLMFIGLTGALKQGDKVAGELEFEKAGKVAVEFAVEAPGARPSADGEHVHGRK